MTSLSHSPEATSAPRRACGSSPRLESWILVLSIAAYPVIAGLSQLLGIDNRPLSIAMRGALLAVCLVVLLKSPFARLSAKNIVFWAAWWCFWIAYLSRLLLDTVIAPVILPLASNEYWLFAVGTCFIPALAAACGPVRDAVERGFHACYWLLVSGAALNLIVLFVQRAIGDIDTLRAETEVLNPIALGHLGVSILLLSIWRLNEQGIKTSPSRAATYASCAVAAFTIFISASKGPIIALLCALAVYAVSRPGKFFSRYLSASLLLLPIVVAINFDIIQNSFLVARIAEGVFSDGIRINLLTDAMRLIQASPVTGAGIEPLDTYPHNLVVESFLAFGWLTGISFCTMLIVAIVRLTSLSAHGRSFWAALLFVQYCVAAMFSGSLYGSYAFWVLMVVVISLPAPSPNILTRLPQSPHQ